jgi:hypothetical protein
MTVGDKAPTRNELGQACVEGRIGFGRVTGFGNSVAKRGFEPKRWTQDELTLKVIANDLPV